MRIRFGQDMATALLFIVVGIAALIIGWDYPRGTPQRPGTGVLPAILSWCLVGTGGALVVKSVLAGDIEMGAWAWRPLIAVTAATIAFGLLVDDLGLVLTMIVSLTLCAIGTTETRWREYLIFLAIMIALGWGTFIWLLGMPIPTWPTKLQSYFNLIFR